MMTHADTRSILTAFFRRQHLFLLFFIPITLCGALYLLLATPSYESTAKLLVKFGQEARPESAITQNNNGTVDEHHELVQSNVKILTSRDLAENLLNDISIAKAYPKIAKDPPRRGTAMDAAVKQLNNDLAVKTDTDSSIMTVGLYNADPNVAATMLHHLVDLFVTRQSEIYSNPQTSVLREQADEAYHKLQDADRQLHLYKAEAGIASIDEEINLLLQQRADIAGYMSRRSSGSDGQYIASQAGAKPAGALTALPGQFSTGGGDRFPVLDDTQKKIGELRAREIELSQTYSPNSEVMQNLRSNINTQMAARNASAQALSNQVADLDRQIADKDLRKSHYEELMRNVQMDEDIYKAAQGRAQEAETDQDLNQRKITQISVIEQPTVPYKPSRPWKMAVLVLCLVCGLTLGLAACIIAENLDGSFSLPEQMAAAFGVPIVASFAYHTPIKTTEGKAPQGPARRQRVWNWKTQFVGGGAL